LRQKWYEERLQFVSKRGQKRGERGGTSGKFPWTDRTERGFPDKVDDKKEEKDIRDLGELNAGENPLDALSQKSMEKTIQGATGDQRKTQRGEKTTP